MKPLQSSYPIAVDEESKTGTPVRKSQMAEQAVLRQSTDFSFNNCIDIGTSVTKDDNGRLVPPTSLELTYSEKETYKYFMDGIFV